MIRAVFEMIAGMVTVGAVCGTLDSHVRKIARTIVSLLGKYPRLLDWLVRIRVATRSVRL